MLWVPSAARFASNTTAEAKVVMAVENAQGFSGSLAWNTRFLEMTAQGKTWTPEDARMTGLVRRWDPETETLLVWRIDHGRAWLTVNGPRSEHR